MGRESAADECEEGGRIRYEGCRFGYPCGPLAQVLYIDSGYTTHVGRVHSACAGCGSGIGRTCLAEESEVDSGAIVVASMPLLLVQPCYCGGMSKRRSMIEAKEHTPEPLRNLRWVYLSTTAHQGTRSSFTCQTFGRPSGCLLRTLLRRPTMSIFAAESR